MTPHPHDYANILNKILEIAEEYGIEFKSLPRIELLGTDKEGDLEFIITLYYESGSWVCRVTDNGFLEHDLREHLLGTKKDAIKKAHLLKGLKFESIPFVEFFQKVLKEIQKQECLRNRFSGYFVEDDCGYLRHILVLDKDNERLRVSSPYKALEMPDYPQILVEAFYYRFLKSRDFNTLKEQGQILEYEEKYHIKGDKS